MPSHWDQFLFIMSKCRTEHHLNCGGWRQKPPSSVSSLCGYLHKGCAMLPYYCSNTMEAYMLSYIVKCSLPLKVHVKYNILNIWFGYKKYLSSCWRVSSVVDTCARNADFQLLLQVTAANGKTQWASKCLGNHDLLNYIWQKDLNKLWTTLYSFVTFSSCFQQFTEIFGASLSFPLPHSHVCMWVCVRACMFAHVCTCYSLLSFHTKEKTLDSLFCCGLFWL